MRRFYLSDGPVSMALFSIAFANSVFSLAFSGTGAFSRRALGTPPDMSPDPQG